MTPYPQGAFRRRIRVEVTGPDTIEGGLEDDFHHFEVTLSHDGERVTGAEARAVRWPWTTCPDAAAPLRKIVGMELLPRCLAVGDRTDPRANCTHMFDLAGLPVAHASRGEPVGARRQYDVEIPHADQAGDAVDVRLWRDGDLMLQWTLARGRCIDPPPYSETQWRGGFLRWADRTLEPELAEAAIVLRRACDIGMGRGMDLDGVDRAEELEPLMLGVCYSMQPEQIHVALRNKGTIRDFDSDPDALLAGD